MKSRRMTIVSCLCALAATAAGAAYFTSAHTPIQMPARDTGTSGSSSGSQPDASRETASRQLLNAMPSAADNGRRWETVSQEGAFMQPPASGGSGMELRKPMPPPTLSPNENTDSTKQLANANKKPSPGNTGGSSENEEGGGLPPTTDKPVVDGENGTSSAPESGNSSEGQPSEPEPSDPSAEEPSGGENQSSESAGESSAQESSSAQSEEGADSSQPPQSEASSSNEQAEGTSTQESQQ